MIVGIVAVFLNLFSDGTAKEMSPEYAQFVAELKENYRQLDASADSKCDSLDKNQIHAVFYALYFGSEQRFSGSFYDGFVECFIS